MTRITISLPDELAKLVTREARRQATSVSEVVRGALRMALGLSPDTPTEIPFAGIGRSGRRHTARNAEDILAREWSRDRRR
jgi:metal-responsive CopG/Arc/MetJ family transcriptional regulator